jgi:pimeloyl-ACP methyl ester carboxylesterase
MQTRLLIIALFAIGLLLVTACSNSVAELPIASVPVDARHGALTDLEACTFQAPGSDTRLEAECATLSVAENRADSESRLIGLPVVRVPSTGADPDEPVFILLGGPGASNFLFTPPDWLLAQHDVVLVGYRGVDGTSVLQCPAVARQLKTYLGNGFFSNEARAAYADAVNQCAAEHQAAGVDLAGYSGMAVIEDMEAARVALGYERINLYSSSYGTRLAQLYAYTYPESLKRLVLISVNPPGHFLYDPADLDQLMAHMSELCAADPTCSSRTDDLARTFYEVNRNMPERWLTLKIDPDSVRMATHMMFFNNRTMPMIIDAYLAAGAGDYSGLALLSNMGFMMPVEMFVYGDQFHKGGSFDKPAYAGIASISLGQSVMGAPLAEMVWPMAMHWPVEPMPEELRSIHATEVEMLLINGTLDFSTPPMNMDEVKPYFHNAQYVLLPEFSHVADIETLQPEAFAQLITSYYAGGVADDSGFVYEPLAFTTGMRLPLLAKLLAAVVVAVPLLAIGGVVLLLRRRRKSGS